MYSQRGQLLARDFIAHDSVTSVDGMCSREPVLALLFQRIPAVQSSLPWRIPLHIGTQVGRSGVSPASLRHAFVSSAGRHCVGVTRSTGGSALAVHVLFHHDAVWQDVLAGYLHGVRVQVALETRGDDVSDNEISELIAETGRATAASSGRFISLLEEGGWWVGQPMLEHSFSSAQRVVTASA